MQGVNLDCAVVTTLHTASHCAMDPRSCGFPDMSGKFDAHRDCNVIGGNFGRKVHSGVPYGVGLNKIGGGLFVVEWRADRISAWFFTHGHEPKDYLSGSPDP